MTSPGTIVTVSDADVRELRERTGELTPEYFADQRLAEIIAITMEPGTTNVNLDRAAMLVWERKAARYADLVTTSESGSTRQLSDLHKNALAMARSYREKVSSGEPVVVPPERRPRTRRITRR